MIEYLFFNKAISLRFLEILKQKKVAWEEEIEAVDNAINIKVSEDIGDDLWDELDDIFDELSIEDQMITEAKVDGDDLVCSAGIYLQLAGGKQTIAKIDPLIMNKMLEVITMEEFNDFIEVIVSSVEEPDDSPICKSPVS
jgi:hypothetical protein